MVDNPELTPELIARYLQRRSKDLEECRVALTTRDWGFFEDLGHKLKGNALSFGFSSLGILAREIELAAQSKSLPTLEAKVAEFETWLAAHLSNG